MKLLLFFSALLFASSLTMAQIPGRSIKQYTTRMGTVVHVGDTLQLGRGHRNDGSFTYASIPMLGDEKGLPAAYSGRRVVVKDLREIPYKTGPQVTTVFKAGLYNAKIDLDSSEEMGEVLTQANKQKATPTSGGVADELLKLKQLLDAGAITQTEFDSQKAKLLNR
jgi:hypothetical protein